MVSCVIGVNDIEFVFISINILKLLTFVVNTKLMTEAIQSFHFVIVSKLSVSKVHPDIFNEIKLLIVLFLYGNLTFLTFYTRLLSVKFNS